MDILERERNLPQSLKDIPVWMKSYPDSKGVYKRPRTKQGPIGWKDPLQWFTWQEVRDFEQNLIVLTTGGLVCLDFDHVILDNGRIIEPARKILRELYALAPTYAEVSTSGTGIHMFYWNDGKIPEFYYKPISPPRIVFERDAKGEELRFCEIFCKDHPVAMTGRKYAPVIPSEIALLEVAARLLPDTKQYQQEQQRAREPPQQPDGKPAADRPLAYGDVIPAEAAGHAYDDPEVNKRAILRALEYIDPDVGYFQWLMVGTCLKNEGFSLDVWEAWSRKGHKYHEGDCSRRWNRLRGSFKDFNGKSIYGLAKKSGYEPKSEGRSA